MLQTQLGESGHGLSLPPANPRLSGALPEHPPSIIDAAPTDGLWGDDRTDEDQIGASYPELEWAMAMDEQGKTEVNFTGRELEVFKIYKRFNRANKHKMIPIPVCEIPKNLK